MAGLLPPPFGVPFTDPQTGLISPQWQAWQLSIQSQINTGVVPVNAPLVTWTADSDLTNDANLGSLATGYLKVTVAAGVASPSTVTSIPGADVTGAALTKTDDTNVTLTLGGTPATSLLRAASITAGWTGTLAAPRGGTGQSSYAVGDLLYASATNALSKLADVATGRVLASGGVGVAPAYTASPTVTTLNATTVNGTTVNATTVNAAAVNPTVKQTYTVANVTTDRAYDADATTLPEIADVLGTLIADLRAIGLVN